MLYQRILLLALLFPIGINHSSLFSARSRRAAAVTAAAYIFSGLLIPINSKHSASVLCTMCTISKRL